MLNSSMPSKLLLCTDLDRTLLPNGAEPEHPQARKSFRRFCQLPFVTLVYVSGRDRGLVQQAIAEYALPQPDYAVTDVGTTIYAVNGEHWHKDEQWHEHLAVSWRGLSRHHLQQALDGLYPLVLQSDARQNRYKLSYEVPAGADTDKLLKEVRSRLAQLDVNVELIWSIDDIKHIGLLDILPLRACKRKAIDFLQHKVGCGQSGTVFAGDSGNDLAVLASPIRSVLVANATEEVREAAVRLANKNGNRNTLYIADNNSSPSGGNYSAGILQGIAHFYPELKDYLEGDNVEEGDA
ncbi:MAG: HAD-IIB family hydrolase [Thermodesulfobacteriota bacterium]